MRGFCRLSSGMLLVRLDIIIINLMSLKRMQLPAIYFCSTNFFSSIDMYYHIEFYKMFIFLFANQTAVISL